MPIDYSKYPADWRAVTATLKKDRASFQCECTGQCGLHRGRRCTERHGQPAAWAKGRIRLTTAHLCTCSPLCSDTTHLLVMCQRCHLRMDMGSKLAKARRRRLTAILYNQHPHPSRGGSAQVGEGPRSGTEPTGGE